MIQTTTNSVVASQQLSTKRNYNHNNNNNNHDHISNSLGKKQIGFPNNNNNTNKSSATMTTALAPSPLFNNKLENDLKFSVQTFLQHTHANIEDQYVLGRLLGEGGFGSVYAAQQKHTEEERAAKQMERDRTDEEVNEEVIREFLILKEMDHPNIVKVYDLFEETQWFYIVTDLYGGGDLIDYVEQPENTLADYNLPEPNVKIVMNKLLSCVHYLHTNCQLAHRDLKLENILLESNQDLNEIKLIDFGLAQRQNAQGNEIMTELVGSTQYIAPQVIEGEYTSKCDLWSCGVIAYCLLAGYTPFDAGDDGAILQAVLVGLFDFDDDVWINVSKEAKDFICNLLAYNEEERPTAAQALSHPWLQDYRKEVDEKDETRKKVVHDSIRDSLMGLRRFKTRGLKLKQAVCALMASQLLKKEEKDKYTDAFRILNPSLTGSLTKADLVDSFRVKAGLAYVPDDVIDGIFNEVNFSKSGEISYSEYSIAMMFRSNEIGDDKLTIVFEMLDKDGDGKISANDLVESLKVEQEVANQMMDQVCLSKKRDKTLDFKEFRDMILSTRNSMDDENTMKPGKKRGSVVTTRTKIHPDGRKEIITEVKETKRDGTVKVRTSSEFYNVKPIKNESADDDDASSSSSSSGSSSSSSSSEEEEEKPIPKEIEKSKAVISRMPSSLAEKRRRMALRWSSVLNGEKPGTVTTETTLDKKDPVTGSRPVVMKERSVKARVNCNLFSSKSKKAPEFDWQSMDGKTLKIASKAEQKTIKPLFDWFCLAKNQSFASEEGSLYRQQMKKKEEEAAAKEEAARQAEEKFLWEQEQARKKAEQEEARKKAEAEAAALEAKRKAEEEKRKREQEEKARKMAEEEEARRKAEEAALEAKRIAEEEKRRKEEEELARKLAEEQEARKKAEAAALEAKRQAEEEKRRQEEEAARNRAAREEEERKAKEAKKQEKERIERLRAEAQQLEEEKRQKQYEKLQQERLEAERIEEEKERVERLRAEAEQLEEEKRQKQYEKLQQERLEAERKEEEERLEKLEQERVATEEQEKLEEEEEKHLAAVSEDEELDSSMQAAEAEMSESARRFRPTGPKAKSRGPNVFKPAPNMSHGKMKFPKNARRVSGNMGDGSGRMDGSSTRMDDSSDNKHGSRRRSTRK